MNEEASKMLNWFKRQSKEKTYIWEIRNAEINLLMDGKLIGILQSKEM